MTELSEQSAHDYLVQGHGKRQPQASIATRTLASAFREDEKLEHLLSLTPEQREGLHLSPMEWLRLGSYESARAAYREVNP
jgi:hypothetical protein